MGTLFEVMPRFAYRRRPASADFLILRNRYSGLSHQAVQGPSLPAADSSAQAVRPCPPMTHWRKRHTRLSAVQRCASASPWACRLPGSLSRLPIQATAGSCPPVASRRSIIIRFQLALIGQLVTVLTGEDWTAEVNCHVPPASSHRAKEPHPPPAKKRGPLKWQQKTRHAGGSRWSITAITRWWGNRAAICYFATCCS